MNSEHLRWHMPLGIIELLRRVGEPNVKVQFLTECQTNVATVRKGRNQATRITFETGPATMTPGDVVQEHPRNVGIVVWLPYELAEKAMEDYKAGKAI